MWLSLQKYAVAMIMLGMCFVWLNDAAAQLVPVPQGEAPVRDPQHLTQRHVANYVAIKRVNIVMQQRDYSCGAAALATLMRFYWGDDVNEDQLLVAISKILTDPAEIKDRIKNGLTMTDLRKVAVEEGYQSVVGRLSFKELAEAKSPVLVGIVTEVGVGSRREKYDHFVIFRGADSYYVYLADPARGNIRIPIWQFLNEWQKNAVLVVAKPGVDPPKVSALTVRDEEKVLGWTNRQVIRKDLARPYIPGPYPLAAP